MCGPGLRIVSYKKRVVIAFEVVPELVAILGVFYAGQDYETFLYEPDHDSAER